MATLEEAAQARDEIADAVLDGESVLSVGIESHDGDYSVGVTAAAPVEIPQLSPELAGVEVDVVITDGPVVAHDNGSAGLLRKIRSFLR